MSAREHRLSESCWCEPEPGIALVGTLPPPPDLDDRSYSAILKHRIPPVKYSINLAGAYLEPTP